MSTVKQIREAAGLTQQQLANRAGISQSYLAQIETGDRGLTQKRAKQIATAAGAPDRADELRENASLRRVMLQAEQVVKKGLTADTAAETRQAVEALLKVAEHPRASSELQRQCALACRRLTKGLESSEKSWTVEQAEQQIAAVIKKIKDADYNTTTEDLLEAEIAGVFNFLTKQSDEYLDRLVEEAGEELGQLVDATGSLAKLAPKSADFLTAVGDFKERLEELEEGESVTKRNMFGLDRREPVKTRDGFGRDEREDPSARDAFGRREKDIDKN